MFFFKMCFFAVLIISTIFWKSAPALGTTEKLEIIIPDRHHKENNTDTNTLVQEQTDLIKKIVSSQALPSTIDYPVVTRKDAVIKPTTKLKEERERDSIEELRKRCQELAQADKKIAERRNDEADKIKTVEAFGPNGKPTFLQRKQTNPQLPSNFSTPQQVAEATKFFVVNRTKTANAQMQAEPLKAVQMEPVILQKMILPNGNSIYYWFKTVPLAQNDFKYPSQLKNSPATFAYPASIGYMPYMYKSPQSINNPQLVNTQHPVENAEKLKPAVDLLENQNNQLRNQVKDNLQTAPEVLPKYEIEYGPSDKIHNGLYRNQLKFVLPLALPDQPEEEIVPENKNWQLDPYAYYPRSLQPSSINVRVPYVPTYYMIRNIKIPNAYVK